MRQFLCLLFLFSFISNKTLTSTNALRYCVCHYVCILCSLCFMYFICCNLSKKKTESLNFFYMFPWIFVGFFFFSFPELQNKTLTSGLFAILKNFVLVYFFFKPLRQVLRQRTTSENKNCGNLQCWSVCFVCLVWYVLHGCIFGFKHFTSVLGIVVRCNTAAGPLGCPSHVHVFAYQTSSQMSLFMEDKPPTQM